MVGRLGIVHGVVLGVQVGHGGVEALVDGIEGTMVVGILVGQAVVGSWRMVAIRAGRGIW